MRGPLWAWGANSYHAFTRRPAIVIAFCLSLAACGGGGGAGGASGLKRIDATVSGLAGSGLVLQVNGGNGIPVTANGKLTLAYAPAGQAYTVKVKAQPTNPTQTCTVSNGMGVMGPSDVDDVVVACSDKTFKVSAVVTGLAGSGLVLRDLANDGGGGGVPIIGNGTVTLTSPLADGGTFLVKVEAQPTSPWQTCTLADEKGGIRGADATVTVTCTTNRYTVGGSISGYAGSGLVLSTPGQPDLTVAPGATSFQFQLESGSLYKVVVKTQPIGPWETCTPAGGEGVVGGADVSVSVTCTANQYPVGGTIVGYDGSGLVLSANGQPDLAVPAGATLFSFANTIASGSAFAVTVKAQPTSPWQTCAPSNGGIVGGADVSVGVTCTTNRYWIGGSISGYVGSGLVLSTAAEPDLQVSSGATSFSFANPLNSGSAYAVSVKAQPTSSYCTVANGGGTLGGGDVMSVSVTCKIVWKSVATSGDRTYAVGTDGSLWAWGDNTNGLLGDGTNISIRRTPVQIPY